MNKWKLTSFVLIFCVLTFLIIGKLQDVNIEKKIVRSSIVQIERIYDIADLALEHYDKEKYEMCAQALRELSYSLDSVYNKLKDINTFVNRFNQENFESFALISNKIDAILIKDSISRNDLKYVEKLSMSLKNIKNSVYLDDDTVTSGDLSYRHFNSLLSTFQYEMFQ